MAPSRAEVPAAGQQRVDQVAGVELHSWTYGSDLDDETMVMVHGLRGTHHGLELIAQKLSGRRIVVPDLPGFGASAPMPDRRHDVTGYASVMTALLEHLGAARRPVVLLGHSFGSVVAAAVAAHAPALVRALVLVNPIAAPPLHGQRVALARLASALHWLGAALPPAIGRALLSNPGMVLATTRAMIRTDDRQLRRMIYGSHLRHFSRFSSPARLHETYRASTSSTVADVAAELTMPTLLVAGATDDIAPVTTQHSLARQLPNAELAVLPEVGHLVHYERPGDAARAIQQFLGRVRG